MEKIYETITSIIDVILVIIYFIIIIALALFATPLHWIEVIIFNSFNVTIATANVCIWTAYNWPTMTNDGKATMIKIGNAIEEELHYFY